MGKSELDKLIEKRDRLRESEKDLTEKIKEERKRISDEKKANAPKQSNVTTQEYKKLRKENTVLRALVAKIAKDSGLTYKQVGEYLGVSSHRARDLVDQFPRTARFYLRDIEAEERGNKDLSGGV